MPVTIVCIGLLELIEIEAFVILVENEGYLNFFIHSFPF